VPGAAGDVARSPAAIRRLLENGDEAAALGRRAASVATPAQLPRRARNPVPADRRIEVLNS